MMYCAQCASKMLMDTIDNSGEFKRRYYVCMECGWEFWTIEVVEEEYLSLWRKAQNFDVMISDHSRQKARGIIERNHV